MLEVPDVDFIRPCGIVVFALFYCRLDLCCGERYVGCLQFECVPIYVSVCFVRFIVGELFVECLCSLCGKVNVFSLKVMVLFLGCVFCCWLVRVLSSKQYVSCVCDPSVCLGVPSICQICVFV